MELIDNINALLGEDLKGQLKPGAKLKIAASCFSIYAYVALKKELESIDSLEFVFTSPTFVPSEASDKLKKEQREFHIPKAERERSITGSEFEIQLKNKLTQKAIARECADWIRRKATFRSNRGQAPMQPFIGVKGQAEDAVYMPVQGFTAVDLGYQRGNALSNIVTRFDEPAHTGMFLNLFEQIWNDPDKLEDVTARLCEHIASVYQENAPERIYFLMLYNIFREFLEDVSEDVLPNELTGYQDTLIWQKLFNFQRDAATGLINKLETYNGCILADSVGLGKNESSSAFTIRTSSTFARTLFAITGLPSQTERRLDISTRRYGNRRENKVRSPSSDSSTVLLRILQTAASLWVPRHMRAHGFDTRS